MGAWEVMGALEVMGEFMMWWRSNAVILEVMGGIYRRPGSGGH